MNSAKLFGKPLRWFAVLILVFIAPSVTPAQKEKGSGSGAASHPAPSQPSGNNSRGGGSTGGNGAAGGNTYGSKGGGSTGAGGGNTTGGGTHNSNPYGTYGNAKGGSTGGTEAGKSSNPYGSSSGSKGGTSMYGSYGSKSPTTSGPGGTSKAPTGSKGTTMYGNYGSKGANPGGAGGSKGGTFGATKGTNNSFAGKGAAAGGNLGTKGVNNVASRGPSTPAGGRTVTGSNGNRVDYNRAGTRTALTTKNGTTARFDTHGRVSSIQAHGITINRAGRERTVVTERADHSRLVSMGRGRGYSERGYMRGGHEYMGRTYFVHGRAYARAYRGYYWHGYRYWSYAPAYYYSPGFYGWAYNPWVAPVAFGWGWGGAPWYGYYGYYFTPYPVYPSAAFWLTDYMMAQSLQAAYEAGQESAWLGGGELVLAANQSVVLTPEVKKAIADEIAAIIASEKNASANPNADSRNGDVSPDALDPAHRVFIVATALSEQTADGTSCSLSPGDAITRVEDTPDAEHNVKASVTAAQRDDCSSGTQVSVSIQDLQDMHNHLREQVDDGLSVLSRNQGKGGLPSGPAGNPQANPDGQAQADPNVGSDLQQQQQAADQAEKDVQQSASASTGGA